MSGPMHGLMQHQPLMISSILRHAARHHGRAEVVSRTDRGDIHRTDYAQTEIRARQLMRVLRDLGVRPGDRVATLAWNGHRHLELYFAISGMGAICHTVNPRLSPDDIAYIINHAGDRAVFADPGFGSLLAQLAPAIAGNVRDVVMMTEAAHMPDVALAPGMRLLCYETLMAAAEPDADWPRFDERTASAICYTSGTTGRPKGVVYSHRSTVLYAMGTNAPDVLGLRAVDRVLPVVPMFHVNGWCIPYLAPMAGAALVLPGRHLDGASLHAMLNNERVTVSAGVPTVWLGLLEHLRATGGTLDTLQRLLVGGSAVPRLLMEAYDALGVTIHQAWGMTESHPVATWNAPMPATAALTGEEALRVRLTQGRTVFGVDVRVQDDSGRELPWDGATFGNLAFRGHWVATGYFGAPEAESVGDDGWFPTGDVGTMDENGFVQLTDRTKDVIKSGGEWISSIQLENIAVSHPDVAEAAVIAARDPKWDERPLLFVVPREGRSIDTAGMLDFYRGKVPNWWVPDAVLVMDALPHTATGKLHKLVLRERYRDHLVRQADGADLGEV